MYVREVYGPDARSGKNRIRKQVSAEKNVKIKTFGFARTRALQQLGKESQTGTKIVSKRGRGVSP